MAYSNIKDPSAYFQTKIYTGDGQNNRAITYDGNSDMQPDFLWFKLRSTTGNHVLLDSSRGSSKYIRSNNDAAESTSDTLLKSFDSDGFTVGDSASTNYNTYTLVSWGWKANGGTTTSVSASGTGQASINASTHQVNQDAGFSIITYTGRGDQISNGEETKLTHGLGVKPDFTIMKKRDGTGGWIVMGKNVSAANPYSYNEHLAFTDAALNAVTYTGNAYPDSTYIYLGKALMNDVGDDYVCYAFTEKQGYSNFGKYVGNGSDDGPFTYTGFKPAFLMMKRTDSSGNWVMFDNTRDTGNVTKHRLFPNLTNADNTTRNYIDLLSNGFKMRNTDVDHNASGSTIMYIAFAENPFVAGGVPTTAR